PRVAPFRNRISKLASAGFDPPGVSRMSLARTDAGRRHPAAIVDDGCSGLASLAAGLDFVRRQSQMSFLVGMQRELRPVRVRRNQRLAFGLPLRGRTS